MYLFIYYVYLLMTLGYNKHMLSDQIYQLALSIYCLIIIKYNIHLYLHKELP